MPMNRERSRSAGSIESTSSTKSPKEHTLNASVSAASGNRSQAWFRPGRYVPVRRMPVPNIRGVEVLPEPRRGVHVGRTTIHGTAGELRELAAQILRAVGVVEAAESQEAQAGPGTADDLHAA
jgi:hypothetical protein